MQKSFSFSGRASNPAKKKASPAQLAARKKFAEMARSGAFKKAKRVVKVKKNPIVPNENFDYVMIQDIKFVAENDANLYRRQGQPIVENLAKKMAKGTFDAAKAVKLYEYLADSAVKDYSVSQLGKRTPTLTILSKPERQVLAQQLFESYADEIKDAAKEIMAKSGKNKLKSNPIAEMREFTVIKWKRGKNTTNGNPVFEFELLDKNGNYFGKTKPNAGWVYGIGSISEGDKINAVLEETKSGRVYMVDYGKRKANPVKRSSRSAVVPNPAAKKPQKVYRVSIMQDGLHTNWMGIANFFTFTDAEKYSRYLSKQHPNWAIKVHDTRVMK